MRLEWSRTALKVFNAVPFGQRPREQHPKKEMDRLFGLRFLSYLDQKVEASGQEENSLVESLEGGQGPQWAVKPAMMMMI